MEGYQGRGSLNERIEALLHTIDRVKDSRGIIRTARHNPFAIRTPGKVIYFARRTSNDNPRTPELFAVFGLLVGRVAPVAHTGLIAGAPDDDHSI